MSLKTTPLRNAIVIALAASCTTPAFAQEAGDTPTNLDRIEITGGLDANARVVARWRGRLAVGFAASTAWQRPRASRCALPTPTLP